MPRTSVARQASALSMQDPWYSADLLPQLQSTLAALADIEVRYQSDQEQLQAWRHGPRCPEKVVLITLRHAVSVNGKPPPASKARVDCNLRSERQRRVLMDEVAQLARQLLDSGVTRLSEREQRVILHIAKRSHVARNVNSVLEEQQTLGERLADRVAQFGGSWTFITIFTGMLMAWIVLNSVALVRIGGGFDPYPYIFLNLILSMVAALQAPVILMSQNRQAARDRLAASLDYEVNLKAEVEIMALHDKLDRIRVEHLEGLLQDQTQRVEELDKLVRATLAKPLSS